MSVELDVGMIYWPGRREPEDAEAIELAFLNHCVAFGGAPFERKGCGWHPKEQTLTAHRTFQIPESPFHRSGQYSSSLVYRSGD